MRAPRVQDRERWLCVPYVGRQWMTEYQKWRWEGKWGKIIVSTIWSKEATPPRQETREKQGERSNDKMGSRSGQVTNIRGPEICLSRIRIRNAERCKFWECYTIRGKLLFVASCCKHITHRREGGEKQMNSRRAGRIDIMMWTVETTKKTSENSMVC